MLAAAIALAVGLQGQDLLKPPEEKFTGYWVYVGNPDRTDTRIGYFNGTQKLDPPKLSPKEFGDPPARAEFVWLMAGYGRVKNTDGDSFQKRFNVFSQTSKTHLDLAPGVTRLLLRLWDINMRRYNFEHNREYRAGAIDVYLAYFGEAGGEQLFGEDKEASGISKVNTIYIYDVPSFTDPVEMVRETAHEYGHATLWPFGGYTGAVEQWANGYLGERLYIRILRNELAAGRLETIDTYGATVAQLDKYLNEKVKPYVEYAAWEGPRANLLAGNDTSAMNAFFGLAMWMEDVLPPSMWSRAMKLSVGQTPGKSFHEAVPTLIDGSDRTVFNVPEWARKKNLWLPVGAKGRIQGGEIVRREGGWALVKPGIGAMSTVGGG